MSLINPMNRAEFLVFRRGIAYEGNDRQLWAIYPLPMISPAVVVGIKEGLLFREDSFDPLTRVRRGRFYEKLGQDDPIDHYHTENVANGLYGPMVGIVTIKTKGSDGKPTSYGAFDNYQKYGIANIPDLPTAKPCEVQLGDHANATAWRIVAVEKNAFGQQVFTLRGKSLFGALPDLSSELMGQNKKTLDTEKIKSVAASLGSLVDALHHQQPVPIVDVARETARVMVAAWLGQDANTKDLGKVIDKITCDDNTSHENKCVARWAASIINRLHPRGKSAEQENHRAKRITLRPVVDEDAECAVHLVGLLLREFGWAKP